MEIKTSSSFNNIKSSLDYMFYGFYRNEDTVNKFVRIWPCVKINDKYYSCYDGLDLIELDLEEVTISKEIDKSEVEEMMSEVRSRVPISNRRRHLGTAFSLLYTVTSYLVENLCDKLYKETDKRYDLDYLKTCFLYLRSDYYKSPWVSNISEESPGVIKSFVTRCFQFYYEMVRRLNGQVYREGISVDIDKYLIDPLDLFIKEFDYKEGSSRFPWSDNFILRTNESRYTKFYVALEDGDKVYINYKDGKEVYKKGEFNPWCHYVCTGFINKVEG